MTVRELIERLSEMDPEAEAVLSFVPKPPRNDRLVDRGVVIHRTLRHVVSTVSGSSRVILS